MIQIRKSDKRGQAEHGWLSSRHSFSFGSYYDPQYLGFRDLLVINEDRVQPAQGFGRHGHRDMEIISYVIQGELAHKDSMGSGSVLRPGDVQKMSAGSGVQHSEFNHSDQSEVHFLQIWIRPDTLNLKPSYQEATFTAEQKHNRLQLMVSPDGSENSLKIHQDAKVYASILEANSEITYPLNEDRHAWIQVISGALDVGHEHLKSGDGAALSDETIIRIHAVQKAEFLLFDLP